MSQDPLEFLQQEGGYSLEEVYEMNRTFPPLLQLSVRRQLYPKMQFLRYTLGVHNNLSTEVRMPPQYFGARLERILAPRHAFLVYANLPHGKELLTTPSPVQEDRTLWQDFLLASRKPKRFAALCQSWQHLRRHQDPPTKRTFRQIEAFDALFGRGLMAAARNELVQHNNTWPLQHVNISSAQLMDLLIQHGASPVERDHRGVTLLHWACGTGNLCGAQVLLKYMDAAAAMDAHDNNSTKRVSSVWLTTDRDGATPLHWAAAGAKAREFGCGGHVDVCRYLLSLVPANERRAYVNQCTADGNSALMWASWSGTLETVKLLVRHRADAATANRNGCTVAHWAASGGNVHVCRYLAEIVGVDFSVANHGGNTPLTHAVAFGRTAVVEWLQQEHLAASLADSTAYNLAQDFVHWTDGDERRKQVLQLFRDWYAHEEETGGVDEPDRGKYF